MRKTELLIPAGSLEVLKTAVIYGADAVYIGGEAFGLRAKAKNFTKMCIRDRYIKEAAEIIAGTLKVSPKEIIFTSGGSESNNMALTRTAMANKRAEMCIRDR